MATTAHDVPVRSMRDRVIDLLGIGDTYPLTDVNVVADQLKVAFGTTAKIPIENAQAGVTYQLCDPAGSPLGAQFAADGSDATLVLETPKVSENVTYRIRATKKPPAKNPPGSTLPPQTFRFLDESAPVKVGIDTALVIELRDLPLLDSDLPRATPSDPRLIPYGQSVDVWVNLSQEEVVYSLNLDGRDVKDVVRTGNLHDISLPTGPMLEDVVIEVRATKNFLASANRTSETSLLDATLYLKVMANPAAAVAASPSPIIDYAQDGTITIANTQASANYQAYVRTIRDADFIHGDTAETNIVTVPVAGKPSAQVRSLPKSDAWRATPDGYLAVGNGPVPGTDGKLALTVKALADDTMVIVRATKDHQVDVDKRGAGVITSAIALDQSVAVLVRPDPARPLRLRVPMVGAQTGDSMQVFNGQPGVFYYFRPAPSGAELPLPAYFHKRDDRDAAQNKGVGQLAVEIDFSIAADPDDGAPPNPAARLPRSPLLDITPFAAGGSLSVRAVKAQSAVEAKMARTAEIAAVPAIRAEPAAIDAGGRVKIVIPASDPLDQYRVTLEGTLPKPALAGDSTDLTVATDPLTANAMFDVIVTRLADTGIQVERVVQVPVTVRPGP